MNTHLFVKMFSNRLRFRISNRLACSPPCGSGNMQTSLPAVA